nr:protein unc-50 homolog [Tanacetum cinerariifolium]
MPEPPQLSFSHLVDDRLDFKLRSLNSIRDHVKQCLTTNSETSTISSTKIKHHGMSSWIFDSSLRIKANRYDHSIGHTVFVVFSATCIHFLLAGAIVATFCWFVTNTYLREETSNSHGMFGLGYGYQGMSFILIIVVCYQHTKYHKQTKNQWARDDPAFIVICILLLAVSAVAYSVTYDHSIGHTVFVVFSATCIHFLLAGAIVATFCWFVTNTYLREETSNSHVVEQRVEWLYAFDVHCNSFFPLFIVLYVVHFFVSPLLVAHGFVPLLLSNLIFMVAITYYHYLNFLGYD